MLFLLIFHVIGFSSSECPPNFQLIGSRCYFVSNENKNYNDASDFCRSLKSRLPSITNDEEQDSLMQIRSSNVFFLGLEFDFNSELWFWEDGRPYNSSVAQFEDISCYKMCSNMDASTQFQLSDTGLWEIIWEFAPNKVVCATDEGEGGNIDGDFCCWWLLYYVLPIGSSIFGCLFLSLCCIALRRRAREQLWYFFPSGAPEEMGVVRLPHWFPRLWERVERADFFPLVS